MPTLTHTDIHSYVDNYHPEWNQVVSDFLQASGGGASVTREVSTTVTWAITASFSIDWESVNGSIGGSYSESRTEGDNYTLVWFNRLWRRAEPACGQRTWSERQPAIPCEVAAELFEERVDLAAGGWYDAAAAALTDDELAALGGEFGWRPPLGTTAGPGPDTGCPGALAADRPA